MSKSCGLLLASPFLALITAAGAMAAVRTAPSIPAARLDHYVKPSGEAYFVLSLKPTIAMTQSRSHDVVVLIDTSASQVGPYRAKALAALTAALGGLGEKDRVHLLAVDIDAVPLTPTFVAPRSAEVRAALAALDRRVPLASTDMAAALSAVLENFGERSTAARAALYIGDGLSTASFLETAEFGRLVGRLVDGHIAVSSYAVGPRLGSSLLAALANQTGGMLAVDSEAMDAKRAGAYLAQAARGAVLWPKEVRWPKSFAEVYPSRMPPLRADRDSVVIGKGRLSSPVTIELSGETAGRQVDLKWTASPAAASEDLANLAAMVEMARRDNGVTLPTVGSDGLRELQRTLDHDGRQLAKLGEQAASQGNLDAAQRLIDEALRRDPNDTNALAIKKHLDEVRASGGKRPLRADLRLREVRNEQAAPPKPPAPGTPGAGPPAAAPPAPIPPAPADALPAQVAPADEVEGRLLESVEQRRRLITDQVRTEVANEIRRGRDTMSDNPLGVIDRLKRELDTVMRVEELDAEIRAQLRDQITATLQEANRRAVVKDQLDMESQASIAAGIEKRRITDALMRDQERMNQLMDRFNSLMAEGRYLLAEEAAAAEVAEIADKPSGPANTIGVSSTLYSRTKGYWTQAHQIRAARQKAVIDTLTPVEIAHIPFPDDEPVVYPDAQVWLELVNRRQKWKTLELFDTDTKEFEISKALREPTIVEFVEQPLQEVIDRLKEQHKIEIQFDRKALEEAGVGTDTSVTKNLRGISLKSALRLMLSDMDLTYIIRDEVLLITTPEKASNYLITKVYPVADLVVPIQSQPFTGLGGGLGGGQGGFGGGQGGFGGGGFGGQGGGGFGGGGFGGQGGGGGGFFSVPDPVTHRPAANRSTSKAGGKLKQDLRLGTRNHSKSPNSVPTSRAKTHAHAPVRGKAIKLDVPAGRDVQEAWVSYFSAHPDVDGKDVRETSRQLMSQRRFEHLIGMLSAALRAGHPQPWMYEAMGLAMQAAGRSPQEFERALMSSLDFSESLDEHMYAAQYMARCGLEDRALKVFRGVAMQAPLRNEPYMFGLKLAQRLNDLDGIQWSTLGILSQAWPKGQHSVWETAYRAAGAALDELKAQGRTTEADAFKAELDKALERDCVIVVTWTGDADVDLTVEEPTGTVCSFRNPRTTAGGMLVGDTASRGKPSAKGYSEIYVCPQAFGGTYRTLLRKVWGKVTAGKVTVEVYSHVGTAKAKVTKQQISLGDKDAAVVFQLDTGRRKEVLAQQQLANVVNGQLEVNQAILAQQLGGLTDPATSASFGGSRQNLLSGFPFLRSAVGYQPVIIQLPTGANVSTTAVVSADRLYVRVSPNPVFSQIGQVTTFNIASGNSMNMGTPMQGGGFGGGAGGFGGGQGGGGGGFGGGGFGGGGLGGGGLGGGGGGGIF